MTKQTIDHCTYIIRVWKEPVTPAGAGQWRYVLLTAESQQREGFVEIEDLLAVLRTELVGITQKAQP